MVASQAEVRYTIIDKITAPYWTGRGGGVAEVDRFGPQDEISYQSALQ